MARALKATAQVPADHVEVNPSTVKRLVDELNGENEMVDAAYVEDLLARGLATDDVLTDTKGMKNVTPKTTTTKTVAAKTAATKTTKSTAAKVTKNTAAKPTAAKTTAKAPRLPADTFVAELKRLGLTKTQAAHALSVSPSLISEFSGAGRATLMRADRWTEAKKALAAFAKSSLK